MSFLLDNRPALKYVDPPYVMEEARKRFVLAPDIFIQPELKGSTPFSTREVEGAPFTLRSDALIAPHLNGITALGMCQRIIMKRLKDVPQEWRYPISDLFNAFCDAYTGVLGVRLREKFKVVMKKNHPRDGDNIRVQNTVWENLLEKAMQFVDYDDALKILGFFVEEGRGRG